MRSYGSGELGILARTAAFAALLAAGARLSIPWWPAPLTLQTLVLAVGALTLGPWRASLAVLLYLLLGLAGLPVFAGGGGPGYVFLPGFGFLLGFLPAAVLMGLARRLERLLPQLPALYLAALAGLPPVYAAGILYFLLIKGIYGSAAVWPILSQFLIYLPGDFVKALVAAVVASRLDPPDRRKPRLN